MFTYEVSWNHILRCRHLATLFCSKLLCSSSCVSSEERKTHIYWTLHTTKQFIKCDPVDIYLTTILQDDCFELLTSEETTESRGRWLSRGCFLRLFHGLVDSRVLILFMIQLAFCIHEFYIHRFNQPGIQ